MARGVVPTPHIADLDVHKGTSKSASASHRRAADKCFTQHWSVSRCWALSPCAETLVPLSLPLCTAACHCPSECGDCESGFFLYRHSKSSYCDAHEQRSTPTKCKCQHPSHPCMCESLGNRAFPNVPSCPQAVGPHLLNASVSAQKRLQLCALASVL